MRIFVYTICRNEKTIMPYFMRHYSQFADRIVVYDDESDDGTQEIVLGQRWQCGVSLRPCPFSGIDDELSLGLWRECKIEARNAGADWCICADTDELIYHKDLLKVLRDTPNQAIKAEGWQMLADHLPCTEGQIYEEISRGVHDERCNKTILFRPDSDIGWDVGRHNPLNTTDITEKTGVKLLHFRYFGDEHAKARAAEKGPRLSQNNKSHGWGSHDLATSGHQTPSWFLQVFNERIECV